MTRELLEKVKSGKITIEEAMMATAAGGSDPKIVPPGKSKKTGKPYGASIEFPADCYPKNLRTILLRCIVAHVVKDGGKSVLALCDECDRLNAARDAA